MKIVNQLPENYKDRIDQILETSWSILKSRFLDGRYSIVKEAPFQHYFAHIITEIGDLYCTKRDDLFLVDLETKYDDVKGKSKYVDITCGYPKDSITCAIELKFKTERQGAQDHGRIDAFVDIEALELVCEKYADLGRFYMITDSTPYINKSTRGVGTVFTTHDGAIITSKQYHYESKGRENVYVNIRNEYQVEWEKAGDWYFLQIKVSK